MTSATGRPPLPAAPGATRQLGDAAAVALAAGSWLGARVAWPVPLAGGVVVVLAAVVGRRPWVLVLGAMLVASSLGARAIAGLAPPPDGPVDAMVTLVADPERSAAGVRAEARLDGHRVLVRADDRGSGALGAARSGEVIRIEGRRRAPPPGSGWMVPRHLAAVVDAADVERVGPGAAPARAANRIRAVVERSAASMGLDERALYLGFVLGDGREQPDTVVDDFRGTGLSHLMVVSGQNLAFVLVLFGPLVRRIGWLGRWSATIAVVVAFAAVTRFEPSVLRAGAMAVVAVSGRATGRPSPVWRNLCLAVAAMVLIDPLLTRSVGFQLSVAATGAIAVLGPPLAALLPGPRALAQAVATSAAAQVGVTPLLLSFAGGAPVVAIPANVLAGPAAALVTTYGLPAGLIGGLVGGGAATVLHLPTIVGVRWVAAVARVGAGLPLGELGLGHLGVLVVVACIVHLRRRLAAFGAAAAFVVLASPGWALRSPPVLVHTPAGCALWRVGGVTVVEAPGRADPGAVLRDLRRAGVRRVDALVATGSGDTLAAALRHRWWVGRVVDGQAPASVVEVGPLQVVARPPASPSVAARPP